MTIPGVPVRSPAGPSRGPRPLAYLRQGVAKCVDCTGCQFLAECRTLKGPLLCEGDAVVWVGREQAEVRL